MKVIVLIQRLQGRSRSRVGNANLNNDVDQGKCKGSDKSSLTAERTNVSNST